MEVKDLKPCPFCGGEAEVEETTSFVGRLIVIRCSSCGASLRPCQVQKGLEKYAFMDWNRRV